MTCAGVESSLTQWGPSHERNRRSRTSKLTTVQKLVLILLALSVAINYIDRTTLSVAAPQAHDRVGARSDADGHAAFRLLLDLRLVPDSVRLAGGSLRRALGVRRGLPDLVAGHARDGPDLRLRRRCSHCGCCWAWENRSPIPRIRKFSPAISRKPIAAPRTP